MSQETSHWLNNFTLIGFVDKRGHAWHYREQDQGGESNHYPGPVPVADIRKRLLNWDAEERDLYVMLDDGPIKIEDRKAICRSDSGYVMGIFKEGYTPHQYDEWLIQNVENLLDDSLQVGSAGLLRNGAICWVQIEVPDNIKTSEGVIFRPHLTATTSFDGSLATTYLRGANLVVCDNTLSAALNAGETNKMKFKHTRWSQVKLMDARSALELVHEIGDVFSEQVKELCSITVTSNQWEKFLDELVPLADKDGKEKEGRGKTVAENKRTDLQTLYRHDDRCSPWQDTAFGVIQTVNTYQHHYSGVHAKNGDKEIARGNRNMEWAVKGQIDSMDNETLETLEKILVA